MAGMEKWIKQSDNGEYPEPELDPVIIYQDIEDFVDPIIITGSQLTEMALMQRDSLRTRVLGIQVHVCPKAEVTDIYVMDRKDVVDEQGLCLVCGGETV